MADQLIQKVSQNSPSVSPSEASLPSRHPEVNEPSSTKTWKQRLVKGYNSIMSWSSSVFRVVQGVGGVFEHLCDFLTPVKVFFKATKLPKICLSPFVAVDLVVNGNKAINGKSTNEKVKGGLKAVTNVDSLANSVVSSIKIMTAAKIVSDVFKFWFERIAKISFFISFIPLGFSIESLCRMWSLYGNLSSKLDAADGAQCSKCKGKNLQDALELVQKEGIDKLREKLSISKKANLAERVDRLKAALTASKNKKTVAEASAFLKTLSTRIRQQRNYELGDTAIKVVSIVGDIFTLFTPFILVGAVIFLATSAVSLVMMAGRAMLIRKNPFDPNCRSKGEALLEKVFHYRKESSETVPSSQKGESVEQGKEKESRAVRSSCRKACQIVSQWSLRSRSINCPVEAAA